MAVGQLQPAGVPIAIPGHHEVTTALQFREVHVLRWFVLICLSVLLAISIFATCPAPNSTAAREVADWAALQTPSGWRYTKSGWKHLTPPISQSSSEKELAIARVHPALLAALQILVSLAALIAFATRWSVRR